MKKIILSIIVILIGAVGLGLFYYFKPVPSLKDKSPDIIVTAEVLYSDYSKNEKEANKKYFNKIVSVSGKIKQITLNETGQTTLLFDTGDLMTSISCKLDRSENDEATHYKEGNSATIKGNCSGFLMDVVLVNCYFDSNK